jgi:hypothetical protein
MIEFSNADEFITRFEKVYNKKIYRIPYTKKTGERVTMLMCYCSKRWISLPFLSLGVIENKITDKLLAPFQLFETEEGNIISTIKNQKWEIRDTSAHSHFLYADKLFIKIDLTKQNNILDLFNSNIKRKIHKSQKDNIKVKYGTNNKLINQFYQAYTHRMKEISVAPSGKKIIKRQVMAGSCTVFVAYLNNKIVGGATLIKETEDFYRNDLFSTLSIYNKHYVSYALHFAMMCFVKEDQGKIYSLGRSTRGSSVHNYKRHFKGEEIPLYWSYSYKTRNIRDNKLLYKLWKLLPYKLTKIIGPIVSKRVY